MSSHIIDHHTICIQAKGVQQANLEAAIIKWMSYCPECKYYLCLGVNHMNEFMGFGYLWVENKSAYYMLTGKCADGSNNVKYIPDPNFVPKDINTGDWADEADASIAPLIEVPLAPLIPMEPLDGINVNVIPAFVYEQDVTNCLIIRHLPSWVTEEMIYQAAVPFSSDKRYPKIIVRRNKEEAKVCFSSSSHDANFASFMLYKKVVTDGKQSTVLSFRVMTKRQK